MHWIRPAGGQPGNPGNPLPIQWINISTRLIRQGSNPGPMRGFALLASLSTVLLGLGGCMGGLGGSKDSYTPKTVELDMVVNQGSSDTIALYTKNDNSTSKAVRSEEHTSELQSHS